MCRQDTEKRGQDKCVVPPMHVKYPPRLCKPIAMKKWDNGMNVVRSTYNSHTGLGTYTERSTMN